MTAEHSASSIKHPKNAFSRCFVGCPVAPADCRRVSWLLPALCTGARYGAPGLALWCVSVIQTDSKEPSFGALELLQCGNLRLQFPANLLELLVLLHLHLLQMFDGRLLVGR